MEQLEKILVPLTDPVNALPYLKLGASLLPPDGKILALGVIKISEESSLSEGAEEAPIYRAALEKLKGHFPDERIELRTLVRVSHRLSEEIAETVREGVDRISKGNKDFL